MKKINNLIVFSLFLFFLFVSSQGVSAQTIPPGSSSFTVQDSGDLVNNASAVSRSVSFHGAVEITPSNQIIQRYINYGEGGGWVSIGGTFTEPDVDSVSSTHQYTAAKDYTVGVAWIYRDLTDSVNPVKVFIHRECLRVFGTREVKSFGAQTLTYNGSQVAGSQVITAGNPNAYIGPFWGGILSGNNISVVPNIPWSWSWESKADGYDYGRVGSWVSPGNAFGSSSYGYSYPANLVQSVTLNLKSAIFGSGAGIGSWAKYDFNNMVIYSRANQKNPDGTCGSISPISIAVSGQYFGKPQCEGRVDTKKGWCLLNPALGRINPSNPNDPINTWKWSYFNIVYGSVIATQPPVLTPTVIPTQIPAVSPSPTPTANCQGQYFGKPQCDWKGSSAYGQGGVCQLNPALGTINPSNPNDPANYWKWSYCQ